MTQLSKYIQKELKTILHKVQQTPPRRCASLNKIKTLVNQAPISLDQKSTINKSIKKIQNAMMNSTGICSGTGTGTEGRPKTMYRRGGTKSQYVKNLFFENMFLQEKNYNKELRLLTARDKNTPSNETLQQQKQYQQLLQKYQSLRITRLKRQQYLNDLIIKTQRMERLVSLRQENQEKYLKSKEIQEEGQKKKVKEEQIKREIKSAVRANKVRSVYTLIEKYGDTIK